MSNLTLYLLVLFYIYQQKKNFNHSFVSFLERSDKKIILGMPGYAL